MTQLHLIPAVQPYRAAARADLANVPANPANPQQAFDYIWNSPLWRGIFIQYAQDRLIDESTRFLQRVEQYKQLPQRTRQDAQQIVNQYIVANAPAQVNINNANIVNNIVNTLGAMAADPPAGMGAQRNPGFQTLLTLFDTAAGEIRNMLILNNLGQFCAEAQQL